MPARMAWRVLHMCPFQFASQDIRVIGSEVDGGTSLSGISDTIATDGGGSWTADFTNGSFGGVQSNRRDLTMAWRAINAGLSGGTSAVVLFHDQWHQPTGSRSLVPHSDETTFSDESEYESGGASASVLAVVNGQDGGLNATILDIAIISALPLIGGERFTYIHPTWGPRCAEISSVTDIDGGKRIAFIPPIRGGIAEGDAIDFDNPRCVMRRASQPTNALAQGLFTSASITFVEDMRNPDA